jgi:hypothetical protein
MRGDYDGRFFAWLLGKVGVILFGGECDDCGGDCPKGELYCWRCNPYRDEGL